MAAITVKIPEGKYENLDAVDKVISYVLRLDNMSLVGGYGIIPVSVEDIIRQFHIIKDAYRMNEGKQIFHIIFSIDKTFYFNEKQILMLAYKLGKYFSNERQVVFAVHNDTNILHIHMAVNTVSFINGAYRAYWDIDEIKQFADACVNELADEVWFNKSKESAHKLEVNR